MLTPTSFNLLTKIVKNDFPRTLFSFPFFMKINSRNHSTKWAHALGIVKHVGIANQANITGCMRRSDHETSSDMIWKVWYRNVTWYSLRNCVRMSREKRRKFVTWQNNARIIFIMLDFCKKIEDFLSLKVNEDWNYFWSSQSQSESSLEKYKFLNIFIEFFCAFIFRWEIYFITSERRSRSLKENKD